MGHHDLPQLAGTALALRPRRDGALLPGSGRAVQAWWLGHITAVDPALAERLHDPRARRPYSCSPLFGVPDAPPGRMAPLSTDRTYSIRVTGWEPDIVRHIVALRHAPPASVTLAGIPFAVTASDAAPDAPGTTFAALSADRLLLGDTTRDVTLRFLSATSFRLSATDVGRPAPLPFPTPALVWSGLFQRWQHSSPVQLDLAVRDLLATRIAINRFEGRSQRVLIPGIGDPTNRAGSTGGRWVVGYIGDCTYWWPKRDEYLGGVLRLLAAFAAYAGVGQGTAFGLGQARPRP